MKIQDRELSELRRESIKLDEGLEAMSRIQRRLPLILGCAAAGAILPPIFGIEGGAYVLLLVAGLTPSVWGVFQILNILQVALQRSLNRNQKR